MSGTLGGVIVSWNPGAERMYGYTAEEAAGRTVWELVRPAGGSGVVAKNVARLSQGEKFSPSRWCIITGAVSVCASR